MNNYQQGYYIEDNDNKPVYKIVGRVKSGLIMLERLSGDFDDRFDFYSDESLYGLVVLDGYNIYYYGDEYKSSVQCSVSKLDYFLKNDIK